MELLKSSQNYDATYRFGHTIVHVVAPPPKTQEEIERILSEYNRAVWKCWQSILQAEKGNINESTTHIRGIPIVRV